MRSLTPDDLREYLRMQSKMPPPPPVNVHIDMTGLAAALGAMLPKTPDGQSIRTSERIAPYV